MATWGDMEDLTWDQMEHFTWDDLEQLTKDQIARFTKEIWPVLAALGPSDRAAFRAGLFEGLLPPALVADGDTDYTPAQNAALSLWTKQPLTRAELATWLQVFLAVIAILQAQFKDEPAPVQPPPPAVVYVEIQNCPETPEHLRPLLEERNDPADTPPRSQERPTTKPAD